MKRLSIIALLLTACGPVKRDLTKVETTAQGAKPWTCRESDRGACQLTPCTRGMIHTGPTKSCCWPGQVYDPKWTCEGAPTCPEGTIEKDLACEPLEPIAYHKPGCDRGEPQECHALARALWSGVRIKVDGPRALELMKTNCKERRFADSCVFYASILAAGEYAKKDEEASQVLYRALCEETGTYGCLSDASIKTNNLTRRARSLERAARACSTVKVPESFACTYALRLRMEYSATETSRRKARAQLLDLCLGDRLPQACRLALNGMASDAPERPRLRSTLSKLSARRCQQGDRRWCDAKVKPAESRMRRAQARCQRDQHAGWCHWHARLLERHETNEQALSAFVENCHRRHEAMSCSSAARLWTKKNLKPDLAGLRSVREIGCAQGAISQCAALGHMILDLKESADAASPALKRACELENMEGCHGLGRIEQLRGAPKRALEHYTTACAKDSPGACHRLGRLHQRGAPDVPKNQEVAHKHLARACQLSVASACREVAQNYELGRGVVPSAARVLGYHEKACRLGAIHSCPHALQHYFDAGDMAEVGALVKTACRFIDNNQCDLLKQRWVGADSKTM